MLETPTRVYHSKPQGNQQRSQSCPGPANSGPSGAHNAGEFNPTKLATAALSAANAARLAASGVLKLTAGTALDLTGAGSAPGTLLVAWGGWNLRSASVALDKSFLFANQAVNENFSDASVRNLAGLLPMGQYYDDPGEPGPVDVLKEKLHIGCGAVGEIGTLSP